MRARFGSGVKFVNKKFLEKILELEQHSDAKYQRDQRDEINSLVE